MPNIENTPHVPLFVLWKHRVAPNTLSVDQLRHMLGCGECLAMLGACQIAKTFEELAEIQSKRQAGTRNLCERLGSARL